MQNEEDVYELAQPSYLERLNRENEMRAIQRDIEKKERALNQKAED